MVLRGAGIPLEMSDPLIPVPSSDQVLIRVRACAVCRTDLHIVDGELTDPKLPLIPGHEIVGTVVETGSGVDRFKAGDRVGVPWLGWTCGVCEYCRTGRENLCDGAKFTGYTLDGGFAEFTVADHRYCFPIPESYSDVEAAPLLCAGLIGYRALRMAGDAKRIGLYGFGAAAHIVCQLAVSQGRTVYGFTRPGDHAGMAFAGKMGATWAGGSNEWPPDPLDAALIFAPVGSLVPQALRMVAKGGVVVCAGIHMSDIPSFPYADLWEERVVRSVANLTRKDGEDFMQLAGRTRIRTLTTAFPLADANRALDDLRSGRLEGAAVLVVE
ncbi:MAG: zinc-dependent alcohol dehydrogenase family protein [Fimbriimonas sp.]|nr:zinc-dependent alcohol dehydrogenase family protein [Fimbriimonas sp.]